MNFPARIRVFCNTDRGASLVELALVIPFFFVFLAGAVDLGRMYYVGLAVTNAAHAGVEYGSENPTDTAGITTAAQAVDPNVTVTSVSWGCECSDSTGYSASCASKPTLCTYNVVNLVSVTTTKVYTMVLPWNVIITPWTFLSGAQSTITFTKTSTMRGPNS